MNTELSLIDKVNAKRGRGPLIKYDYSKISKYDWPNMAIKEKTDAQRTLSEYRRQEVDGESTSQ